MSRNSMGQGIVKFFNDQKGFGFIVPDGGGDDILVDQTSVLDKCPKEGDRVQFELVRDSSGPRALKIRVI